MPAKKLYFICISMLLSTIAGEHSFNNVPNVKKYSDLSETDITTFHNFVDELFNPLNVFRKLSGQMGETNTLNECFETATYTSSGCKQSLCELLLAVSGKGPIHDRFGVPDWTVKSEFLILSISVHKPKYPKCHIFTIMGVDVMYYTLISLAYSVGFIRACTITW